MQMCSRRTPPSHGQTLLILKYGAPSMQLAADGWKLLVGAAPADVLLRPIAKVSRLPDGWQLQARLDHLTALSGNR